MKNFYDITKKKKKTAKYLKKKNSVSTSKVEKYIFKKIRAKRNFLNIVIASLFTLYALRIRCNTVIKFERQSKLFPKLFFSLPSLLPADIEFTWCRTIIGLTVQRVQVEQDGKNGGKTEKYYKKKKKNYKSTVMVYKQIHLMKKYTCIALDKYKCIVITRFEFSIFFPLPTPISVN